MKQIAAILIFAVLLGGCSAEVLPPCRVVTGAQVEYQQNGTALSRDYHREESICSVLRYLRELRPYGPVIPQKTPDFTCKITLRYSHGPDTVFLQQGADYLCKNGGQWRSINTVQARLLYPLLLLLPSDG